MKFLQDSAYNALKKGSEAWSSLVQGILKDNPDMKAEDVTPEQLTSAISENGNSSALQQQLDAAKIEIESKEQTISKLQSEVTALKGTPAKANAGVQKEKEDTTEQDDIISFVDKNEGNTLAIMDEAKKQKFF